MVKGIVSGPQELPVRLDPLVDFEDRLVSGTLTHNGIQYSQEVTTAGAGVEIAAFSKFVDPLVEGRILWVEFELVAEFRAVSSPTADLTWRWQARNGDGSWVELHEPVLEANIGTAYVARTRGGCFTPQPGFDSVPCEIRLVISCDEVNQGRARVTNCSHARVVYRVI
jgi:hypothetical protein